MNGSGEGARMHAVTRHLEAWREAEHRRAALPFASPAWREASDDVRFARAAYQRVARDAAAYYAEPDDEAQDRLMPWSVRLDRPAARAG